MAVAANSAPVCPAGARGASQERLWGADSRMAVRPIARLEREPPGRNAFASGGIFRIQKLATTVAGTSFREARLVGWIVARADVSSVARTAKSCAGSAGDRRRVGCLEWCLRWVNRRKILSCTHARH